MTSVVVVAIALVVVAVFIGVGFVIGMFLLDRREQREHDQAPPNNRIVGSDEYRHNRIFN